LPHLPVNTVIDLDDRPRSCDDPHRLGYLGLPRRGGAT
jgi:hypothetical protein